MFAEPSAPFTIPLALVNVPSTVEQPESAQTRNEIWPVLLRSGSLDVALRDGVVVFTCRPAAGETNAGRVGGIEAVEFEPAWPLRLATALPIASRSGDPPTV